MSQKMVPIVSGALIAANIPPGSESTKQTL